MSLVLPIFFLVVGCEFIAPAAHTPERSSYVSPLQTDEEESIITPADPEDIEDVARSYLDDWKDEDYAAMYQLLTSISKKAISEEQFTEHYQGVYLEAELSKVDYEVLSSLVKVEAGQVSYRVLMDSLLVGKFQADTLMNLSREAGTWRIQWDDTLVLPQLKGGNYLSMVREGHTPARSNIYDRYGSALVAQTASTAIGLFPDQINPEQELTLLRELSDLIGVNPDTIKSRYASYPSGAGWYLPLGEVPAEEIADRYETLSKLDGLVLSGYKARYYFDGGVAPHLIGHVSAIHAEEVDEYAQKGYQQDERVGRSGLERWGEGYLAGSHGGVLYVMNALGKPVTRLAESSGEPGQAIYTTLDKEFQQAAEMAISNFRGAIVVMERDTGRVLAMVSSPGYNPNAFEPINFNSEALLAALESQDLPLFNRATLGQYPLGSVFKIITMAAALESGRYTPESTYLCGYKFEEIPGVTLYDWTYEHEFPPSGLLNLPGGLIRSCNPWFYHIGLDLFNHGLQTAVADMGRGFGLGALTGIEGVEEVAGQVPDPESQIDATNLAIGQGALLVTPLQVANFFAAIGNGGTLFQPQVIEAITPPGGEPSYVFEPIVNGELPVSQEMLQVIQQALKGVVSSTDPRGTAYHIFTGLDIPVAGKTGTAQTGTSPHAWFAGYTMAEREDKPDIAVVVVAENTGEGSDYAAPIFRRIVELYFYNSPGRLYEWESTYNVTSTPTPEVVGTPTP
ncbi:MAG: penicillin-binding transpeptidase domain-containing protein [Chloroflexota bacterium]|nr:penicillin-binding transpeptidase domain-containing protein [Chloroflexota bacterium]